ncbi:MAG: hypothetical protein JW765_08640 [Deltaproteobacteria bacterium]|nr:hypothetical protein [Candidatus Zymogenaceae bacterium]
MGYLYLAGGVILFLIGVIDALMTKIFRPSFYLYVFLGLFLVIWGLVALKKIRRNEIKDQTMARVNRLADARAVPLKKCPACGGDIEAILKACPICTHRFPVVYTLTVFTPFDVTKREQLIKYLMTRMNRPYEEISIRLEKGMVFKYSNKDDAQKRGASFESLGCKVRTGEIVQDR